MTTPLSWLIGIASLVVIVAGLSAVESIVIPILLAAFFSVLFTTIQSWLINHGLPTILALIITISMVIIIFFLLINILTVSMAGFISDLPELSSSFYYALQDLDDMLVDFEMGSLSTLIEPDSLITLLQSSLKNIIAVMNDFLLIVLLMMFMLLESARMHQKLARLGSDQALSTFARFSQKIKHYMIYKGMFSVITGLIIAFGLWLIDVDYYILWGFLAFLLNLIPTIGSILAAIPPLLLALAGGDILTISLVGGLFLVTNTLIGNLIEPRFMGRGMGLSPLVVLISLLFWGWLFGVVGMFLSVPLTMVIKIGLENSGHSKIAALLAP